MSFEINPVLAGKFDAPDYAPAPNNLTAATDTDDVSGPDPRRYTQFDRSTTEAGSTTDFSFGDLVDMFNPLEHIPVVSAIYREITGEQINPVSRVTGDILYGGFLGMASAVLDGVGAVANTELVAETGKDSGGLVLAALFGPDETQNPVQLADAGNTAAVSSSNSPTPSKTVELTQTAAATPGLAALEISGAMPSPQLQGAQTSITQPSTASISGSPASATTSPAANVATANALPPETIPLRTAAQSTQTEQLSQAAPISNTLEGPNSIPDPAAVAATSPTTVTAPADTATSGMIPLLASAKSGSGKQAFGGVMAPNTPNLQAQDMALALAQGAPSMRLGHTIYTNRLMNGPHSLPPMLSSGGGSSTAGTALAPAFAPPPVVPASFTSSSVSPTASANLANAGAGFTGSGMPAMLQNDALPPELMHDMMLKALSQYKGIAAGSVNPGATINLMN